jgi:hypothetical protein
MRTIDYASMGRGPSVMEFTELFGKIAFVIDGKLEAAATIAANFVSWRCGSCRNSFFGMG